MRLNVYAKFLGLMVSVIPAKAGIQLGDLYRFRIKSGMTRKILLFGVNSISICFLFLFFFVAPVSAESEFRTQHRIRYTVSETGSTDVSYGVILTNNIARLFAKEYTVRLATVNVRDIAASDSAGPITPKVTQENGSTEIVVPFHNPAIGIGNETSFSISYVVTDVVVKNGSVWEITIPPVRKSDDMDSFKLFLDVPPSFGKPAYLSPKPQPDGYWTLEQLARGGVTAAYGLRQAFTVELSYFLENPDTHDQTMKIPIPGDSAYQRVMLDYLRPKPLDMTVDADGNWLASYMVPAQSSLDITTVATVVTQVAPWSGYQTNLTPEQKKIYTSVQPFWESNHRDIAQKAHELKTVDRIYEYVTNQLRYNYQLLEMPTRHGAIGAFEDPYAALCSEFSDLFIALTRAIGIPSRLVHG